jgi:hypothetical protein
MRTPAAIVVVLLGMSLWSTPATSQSVVKAGPIRVFLDCEASGCDFDYLRTEIPYVDYVRDRAAASLHVLVTTQSTGSGGIEHTLTFIGLRNFAGISDTLTYISSQSSSVDDRRKGIAQTLKLGLVRYLARTSAAERVQVSLAAAAPLPTGQAVAVRDPWNYWVFQTRASGNFSGESSQHFANLNGTVSANRVTRALKLNNAVNISYSESKFTLDEGDELASYSRSY